MDPTNWGTARVLFVGHLALLVLLWGVVVAGVALIVGLVAVFGDVTLSGWDRSFSLFRFVAVLYGYHLARKELSVHVAHGQTRRAFLLQSGLFVAAGAAILAGLVTLGYLVEGAIYDAAGWSHAMSEDRLFDSGDEYGAIWVSYTVLLLGWLVAGSVLGAGFGRSSDAGAGAIPAAVVVLAAVTLASHGIPFTDQPILPDDSLTVPVAVAVGAVLAGLLLTWAIARDTPLRPTPG